MRRLCKALHFQNVDLPCRMPLFGSQRKSQPPLVQAQNLDCDVIRPAPFAG